MSRQNNVLYLEYKKYTYKQEMQFYFVSLDYLVRKISANVGVTLPVACPWPVVLSGYSGFFHH